MTLARQEINLRRLLARAELMFKQNQNDDKFIKYMDSLDDMLKHLYLSPEKPIDDTLQEYKRRILNIKLGLGMITADDVLTAMDSKPAIRTREELLGVRQRTTNKGKDLDELIDYHQDIQGKIAEEMLEMTKNLKEQSELANRIIKRDTEVVSRSTTISEANSAKLEKESAKLADHSKRACKCWMWVMLIIVMVVFVNMVFFMKIMKKKT